MPSRQQVNAYCFVRDFIMKYGASPSMLEIAHGIGIQSKGVAHRHVHALIDAGYLHASPNAHRTLVLTEKSLVPYTLPLVGCIAAGKPIEAIETQEVIEFTDLFFGPDRYALKVKGDSMIDEGIKDEDIVICKKTSVAKNGDIVVALIDNSTATLKRIRYNQNIIELIPANTEMEMQSYDADRVTVQGIYVGLCRFNGCNI